MDLGTGFGKTAPDTAAFWALSSGFPLDLPNREGRDRQKAIMSNLSQLGRTGGFSHKLIGEAIRGMRIEHLTNWLAERWVTGAAFIAGALVAIFPLIAWRYSLATQLTFLCSPAYMAHQVEEHNRDRFRQFVNQRLFSGVQAMSVADVLIINLPLVWGVNLLSAYMACLIDPGYGLLAGYAMLINGIGHILLAAKLRSYNPGLLTALEPDR